MNMSKGDNDPTAAAAADCSARSEWARERERLLDRIKMLESKLGDCGEKNVLESADGNVVVKVKRIGFICICISVLLHYN